MDPNQQPPQYPPQFFYPVPGAVDPNQQMYPPQGVPQPMMMQPGMVPPPYVVPQQPQPMMAPQTTGYVVQQPQSPMMTVAPTMSHHVVPNTIPQQVAYVTPTPDDAALLDPNNHTLMLDRSIKERLYDREYTVDTSAWVSEAWDIYKKNYAVFILWSLISIGISFIPYFGGIVSALMSYSFIAAINDTLRPSRVVLNFKNFTHLFINMKYGLHMLLLSILTGLIIAAGLIALVVPGLYFMVVLVYTTPVYLEYRTLGLALTESIFVSGKVLHKRFCGILGFLIICFLLLLAGALALGVGLLITYPLVHITMSIAFREIFAFRENHLYAVANLEQI